MKYLKYLVLGTLFGIILTKSEVVSWFRIQEMFRFQSFHMYGVIGSAILVGMISIQLIKRNRLKSIDGEEIKITDKKFNHGIWIGGFIFGLGWALTGACPGPLFAQLGSGIGSAAVLILAALAGTWTYSALREKLPY
ncbi:YeeE/YedE family protein [Hymenobacter sp. J193]|uniref:YeeE/YedE family protein n=1 Tax=Hymenobacter sp. J193 TaxID=2898429 RepID=UPI002151C669|nr:YeeE/YedE family protein [Hymenobacter sp. J193]MCR5890721.1 YeeE/YedE family protein [Hymenobacter sp. J193]MCR5890825.1 YeeE/YedE family protein [Hymenobacter sp. J193]